MKFSCFTKALNQYGPSSVPSLFSSFSTPPFHLPSLSPFHSLLLLSTSIQTLLEVAYPIYVC